MSYKNTSESVGEREMLFPQLFHTSTSVSIKQLDYEREISIL